MVVDVDWNSELKALSLLLTVKLRPLRCEFRLLFLLVYFGWNTPESTVVLATCGQRLSCPQISSNSLSSYPLSSQALFVSLTLKSLQEREMSKQTLRSDCDSARTGRVRRQTSAGLRNPP